MSDWATCFPICRCIYLDPIKDPTLYVGRSHLPSNRWNELCWPGRSTARTGSCRPSPLTYPKRDYTLRSFNPFSRLATGRYVSTNVPLQPRKKKLVSLSAFVGTVSRARWRGGGAMSERVKYNLRGSTSIIRAYAGSTISMGLRFRYADGSSFKLVL